MIRTLVTLLFIFSFCISQDFYTVDDSCYSINLELQPLEYYEADTIILFNDTMIVRQFDNICFHIGVIESNSQSIFQLADSGLIVGGFPIDTFLMVRNTISLELNSYYPSETSIGYIDVVNILNDSITRIELEEATDNKYNVFLENLDYNIPYFFVFYEINSHREMIISNLASFYIWYITNIMAK